MALEGKDYKVDANLVKEDTFGTLDTGSPVETAFPMISETLTQTPEYIPNDVKNGQDEAATTPTLDRFSPATGQTLIQMDYNNIEEIFHQAVGVVSGTGAAATPFLWEPDAEINTSYSLVIDKVAERWQYTGGIIEGFTIQKHSDDVRIASNIDWIFQKLTRSATAINAAALTASDHMKMSQLVFRIGTQADALAASDELKLTDFTLNWKNNWKAPEYASGSAYMLQPIRDKQREVTFSFTALRYNSDDEIVAIQAAIAAGSKLQADLTFTGTVNGAIDRVFVIQLPELQCTDPAAVNTGGGGNLTFNATFKAYKNSAVATIMTDTTYEALFKLTQTAT